MQQRYATHGVTDIGYSTEHTRHSFSDYILLYPRTLSYSTAFMTASPALSICITSIFLLIPPVLAANKGLGTHGAPEVAAGNAILHGKAVLTVGDGSPVGDREDAWGRGEDGKELKHKVDKNTTTQNQTPACTLQYLANSIIPAPHISRD